MARVTGTDGKGCKVVGAWWEDKGGAVKRWKGNRREMGGEGEGKGRNGKGKGSKGAGGGGGGGMASQGEGKGGEGRRGRGQGQGRYKGRQGSVGNARGGEA